MDTYALDDKIQTRRRKRRRALLAILLSSSLATLGAGAMSLAVFTDSEAADGAWSTGTIILGVQPATTFGATDIMPGDFGTQDVTVENNGSGELRYDLSTTATDPSGLAAQMTLVVSAGVCTSPGATLFSGTLDGAALADRVVAAGADDDLCFAWELPLGSGNAFQNVSTSVTYTFDAEQTANNP
jgi:hypothetical protein